MPTFVSGELLWGPHQADLEQCERRVHGDLHWPGSLRKDLQHVSHHPRWLPARHCRQDGFRSLNVEEPRGYWRCRYMRIGWGVPTQLCDFRIWTRQIVKIVLPGSYWMVYNYPPWVGCPGFNPILDVTDACLMTSIHPVVIEDYHIWLVINQSTQWSSHSTSRNGTRALRLLKSILRCAFCFSFYPIFRHPTSFFNMPDVLLVENQTWKKNLNNKGPCASIGAPVPSIERNFDSFHVHRFLHLLMSVLWCLVFLQIRLTLCTHSDKLHALQGNLSSDPELT